jgi:hypothetical protein
MSHCWGIPGSMRLTTTHATLDLRKAGIPWASIPCTFQDAMLFTRRLGVRYLWIDSLCIIQEDPIDWGIEAANMAEIYSGAHFTIATANAKDSEDGLFHPLTKKRYVKPLSHFSSPLYRPEREKKEEERLVIYVKRLSHYSHTELIKYRLLTRAWVFQERYLSPRVIYFFKDELAWVCKSHQDDESHSPTAYKLRLTVLPLESHERSSQEKIVFWHVAVENYCKLSLSFEKDRLPALAGLAKRMSPFRNGRYLVGLWEDSLISDLAWRCQSGGRRPKVKRAPSWSWASVEGAISFESFGLRNTGLAIVNHVQCETQELHAMDEVSDGSVTISGPLLSEVLNVEYTPDITFDGKLTESSESEDYSSIFYLALFYDHYSTKYLVLQRLQQGSDVYERIGFASSVGQVEYQQDQFQTVTII